MKPIRKYTVVIDHSKASIEVVVNADSEERAVEIATEPMLGTWEVKEVTLEEEE